MYEKKSLNLLCHFGNADKILFHGISYQHLHLSLFILEYK